MELHKGLKPLPPQHILKYHYKYDPDEGKLYKRNRHYHRGQRTVVYTNTWKEVRSSNVGIKGYGYYYKYRIMWCLYYGEDPYPYVIDHINREHGDNRIINLRKVTPKENTANRNPHAAVNAHSRKSVRITYPDGRGRVIVDSLITAGKLLNRSAYSVGRTIRRDGLIYWDDRRNPSGITVDWY